MRRLLSLLLAVVLVVALAGCSKAASSLPDVKVRPIPTVTGLTQAVAATVIKKAGFQVGSVTKAPYPAGAPAVVITQDPAAASPQPVGTKIDMVVAEPAK